MAGWLILVAAVVGVLFAVGYAMKKKQERTTPQASEADVIVYSDVIETTPGGVRVASKNGVGMALLQRIDDAHSRLFVDAAQEPYNYRNGLSPSEFIIYVKHDWVLSPVTRTPSFKVRADNYDGTEYDVDPRSGIGYVYATEYVIQDNGVPTGEYVITNDPNTWDLNVRFGGEHYIINRNDPVRDAQTKTHLDGKGHPLIAMVERMAAAIGYFHCAVQKGKVAGLAEARAKLTGIR